jgi:hypothetical protein
MTVGGWFAEDLYGPLNTVLLKTVITNTIVMGGLGVMAIGLEIQQNR